MKSQIKYTIYLYLDGSYGSIGLSFSSKETAIDKCRELVRLNQMSYGIFLEYMDYDLHHRRLVWKNGANIDKKYEKKLSYTAELVLNFIKSHFSRNRVTPTFLEIKDEIQKRDHDVIRILKILDEMNYIVVDKPISKNSSIKQIKK